MEAYAAMTIINHFAGAANDEKLNIYLNVVKTLTYAGGIGDESTLRKTVNRQERQSVRGGTDRAMQDKI